MTDIWPLSGNRDLRVDPSVSQELQGETVLCSENGLSPFPSFLWDYLLTREGGLLDLSSDGSLARCLPRTTCCVCVVAGRESPPILTLPAGTGPEGALSSHHGAAADRLGAAWRRCGFRTILAAGSWQPADGLNHLGLTLRFLLETFSQ